MSQKTLLDSSRQHIEDVNAGLAFFVAKLLEAGRAHDRDKITDIEGFHRDFVNGFSAGFEAWWTQHRRINRHHLNMADGVPADVNLIDVLDYIADCTMAGMARSGDVYDITLPADVLLRAFANTAAMLKREVVVVSDEVQPA